MLLVFVALIRVFFVILVWFADVNIGPSFIWHNSPQWAMASLFTSFLDDIQRCTTFCKTPLDNWSPRHRDLLTIHNTHNRQRPITPVGFEPTISAGEQLQTYALDRAATGIGKYRSLESFILDWPEQLNREMFKILWNLNRKLSL